MTPIPNFPGYYAAEDGIYSVKKGAPKRLATSGWRPSKASVRTSIGYLNVWAAIAITLGPTAARKWADLHASEHPHPRDLGEEWSQ